MSISPATSAGARAPLTTGTRDVLIIALGLLAILAAVAFATGRYAGVQDAVSLLGVVLPSITTIVAAAFGISLGWKGGAAAGNAGKEAAEKEVEAARQLVREAQPDLLALDRAIASIARSGPRVQAAVDLGAPAGGPAPGKDEGAPDSLDEARALLARVQGRLGAIAR